MPTGELGLAFGLIVASGNLGAVLTMPICGLLSQYAGWPWVFYLFGSVALLFTLPWLYLVYNEPQSHPRISPTERVYITSNLSISSSSATKKKALVPWRSILSSPKIWAIAVTRFCNGWGSLFLVSKLPSYLSKVLHMPMTYVSDHLFGFYLYKLRPILFSASIEWLRQRLHLHYPGPLLAVLGLRLRCGGPQAAGLEDRLPEGLPVDCPPRRGALPRPDSRCGLQHCRHCRPPQSVHAGHWPDRRWRVSDCGGRGAQLQRLDLRLHQCHCQSARLFGTAFRWADARPAECKCVSKWDAFWAISI